MAMAEQMLRKLAADTDHPYDIFIMTGDFVGHNIPIEPEDPEDPALYKLLEDMQA